MKYLRNPAFAGMDESQSEISDELAALWIKNGNKQEFRDTPWPGLSFVGMYFVTDSPTRETNGNAG